MSCFVLDFIKGELQRKIKNQLPCSAEFLVFYVQNFKKIAFVIKWTWISALKARMHQPYPFSGL